MAGSVTIAGRGTKPASTAASEGCSQAIWNAKQIATVATRAMIAASSQRKPRFCKASSSITSSSVTTTPATSGRPKSRFRPIAMPITSARLQATIAISQKTHSVKLTGREKCWRQACARSMSAPMPRRTAAAWNSIAIRFESRMTESSE